MTTTDDNKTVRVNFRTTAETYRLLLERAAMEQRSISSLVNYLVTQALKEDEKRVKNP